MIDAFCLRLNVIANKHGMAKKEKKSLEFFTDWKYEPAIESTDHIQLKKFYHLKFELSQLIYQYPYQI